MMVLLAKGPEYMQYPKVKKPHLECAHTTQSRMLADLTESIGRSYILWKTVFATGHTFIQEPSNEETENFDDLHQHFQTAHIERLLAAEMVKCPSGPHLNQSAKSCHKIKYGGSLPAV